MPTTLFEVYFANRKFLINAVSFDKLVESILQLVASIIVIS